jgi:hypothetical protein
MELVYYKIHLHDTGTKKRSAPLRTTQSARRLFCHPHKIMKVTKVFFIHPPTKIVGKKICPINNGEIS